MGIEIKNNSSKMKLLYAKRFAIYDAILFPIFGGIVHLCHDVYLSLHSPEKWKLYHKSWWAIFAILQLIGYILTLSNSIYLIWKRNFRIYLRWKIAVYISFIFLYLIKDIRIKSNTIVPDKQFSYWIITPQYGLLVLIGWGIQSIIMKIEDMNCKAYLRRTSKTEEHKKWTIFYVPLSILLNIQIISSIRYLHGPLALLSRFRGYGDPQIKSLFDKDTTYKYMMIITALTSFLLIWNYIFLIIAIRKKSKTYLIIFYCLRTFGEAILTLTIGTIIHMDNNLSTKEKILVKFIKSLVSISLYFLCQFEMAQVLRFYVFLTIKESEQVEIDDAVNPNCHHASGTQLDFFRYIKITNKYQRLMKTIEIPSWRVSVKKRCIFGEGNFSHVFKGEIKSSKMPFNKGKCVAVKVFKSEFGTDYFESILSELKTLYMVKGEKHKNLVTFLGICKISQNWIHNEKSLGIIFEYMDFGSLDVFLRKLGSEKYSDKLSALSRILIIWCFQIADGMEYLSSKKIVHGDLSARNILLDQNLTCKISDFGMSLRLYHYRTYAMSNQKIFPWRWLSPESLCDMTFSFESDIWSYGVLVWEIFTLGQLPWPDLEWDSGFIYKLKQGNRLSKPTISSEKLYYNIMLKCWELDPKQRIQFSQIKQNIQVL